MGSWYVAAGRFTMFERDVYNSVESYSYDAKSKKINIDFSYRQGSFEGKLKKIPQVGEVVEGSQNAHWLISPLWPFRWPIKFDYLIIALAPDYSWVAVGVPSQAYLWIMFRQKNPQRSEVEAVIDHLKRINYKTKDLVFVSQKW